jgi:hypothetical protein
MAQLDCLFCGSLILPTPARSYSRAWRHFLRGDDMTQVMIRFGLIAALLVLPTIGQAQPGRGTPEDQRACNGDARRHCREVLDQGDTVVLACLRQHRTKLTRSCQAVLQRHGQ